MANGWKTRRLNFDWLADDTRDDMDHQCSLEQLTSPERMICLIDFVD